MRTLLCSALLAVIASGVVFACASSDEGSPAAVESIDSGGAIPVQDGGASDTEVDAAEADADAGVDAAPFDAAPRACSDQGFCPATLPPKEVLRGVWGDNQGILWSVSETGDILRWDGTSWKVHASIKGNVLSSIWGSSPTDIWIGGSTGLVHGTGTSSSSLTFATVDAPGDTTVGIQSIVGLGPDDIWAVGGSQPMGNGDWPYPATGRVLHYTGPGDGWTLDAISADTAYGTVWGDGNVGVWIQGTIEASDATNYAVKAIVRRRAPGATDWQEVALPPDPTADYAPDPGSISAAGTSSASSMWLVGTTQAFKRTSWHGTSTDEGKSFTWTCIPRPSGDLVLYAIWGTGPNDTWAAGDYGRVRHWDGKKWMQAAIMTASAPISKPFHGIWGKAADDFWVVGNDIALHKTPGKP